MRTVYKYFLSNFTFLRFTIFTIDVLYHFLFFFCRRANTIASNGSRIDRIDRTSRTV